MKIIGVAFLARNRPFKKAAVAVPTTKAWKKLISISVGKENSLTVLRFMQAPD
ncbi:MAG: hypothetical protein IPP51_07870 [Bacteroidetes bacterium]|nr:hypothetical protein [Bacteroidota bacterium]